MANIELYGYGFLAYEFGGVPPMNTSSLSVLEKSNVERGMYAMRSAIVPKIYKIVIQLGSFISPETSPYQVAKLCHSVWTGFLPGSVFLFTLAYFNSRVSALLAAILVALSEPLLVLGTHTLVNSLLSPALFAGLAVIVSITNNTLDKHNRKGTKEPTQKDKAILSSVELNWQNPLTWLWLFVPGFILGVLCYVRVDLILFVTILAFVTYGLWITKIRAIFLHVILLGPSFIFGLITGGYIDWLFYERWFITPIQWFQFNVHQDLATEIFGGHSRFLYIQNILINDPIFLVFILISVFSTLPSLETPTDTTSHRTRIQLLICIVFLLLIYSLKGHKEVRFLHDWIVLALIFCADGILVVCNYVTQRYSQETWHKTALLLSLLTVFAASSHYRFPCARTGSNMHWAYKRAPDSGYVNLCLQWVGQQSDSTGVFVDHDVYGFGGYTILQKRIPIIAKMNAEFREWDTVTRTPTASFFAVNGLQNATSFDDFRLWVMIQNVQRLIKYLLMTPMYNYAVVSTDRKFIEVGFKEVKRFGLARVLQRDNNKRTKQQLYELGNKMPYGKDADVLETEGQKLYKSGLYSQAIERLKASLQMDPKRTHLKDLLTKAKIKVAQG